MMNTHETYVSLETAKLLKQAGFDWEIDTFYHRYYEGDGHDDCTPTEEFYFDTNRSWAHDWNNDSLTYAEKTGELVHLSAPTLSIAQKWLREVKVWDVVVNVENVGDLRGYKYEIKYCPNFYKSYCIYAFNSYELALEAGINKCLEIILDKDEKV